MPYGLKKATNYYNKLEAWRDWQVTAKKALAAGMPEEMINSIAPAEFWPWRKIDQRTSILAKFLLKFKPEEFGIREAGKLFIAARLEKYVRK